MTHAELLSRVSVDPNVCFGRPCIRGHRVWVSRVLDHLASGWPIAKVVANYPGIEEADVLACIAYGADMTRLRDLPPTAAAE
ncbi:MAG TPA: DUF433 domain-containing protein [Thermoleophilia bacterium]|nr:DUF433 domain-containing protein [Thermoleophilia bacterium]